MQAQFSGGDKLDAHLAQTAQALRGPDTVTMGFLEGATYPDGTSVPQVMAANEFGAVIQMPARTVEVYRKVDRHGDFAKNGRFVKRKLSNFATTHQVPAHTVKIPARPFFRTMLSTVGPDLSALVANLLRQQRYDSKTVLNFAGAFLKGKLQESIRTFSTPANAPSTVRAKGFNNPLIDTGHALNSVDYQVGEDPAP